jgi:hypothetical protein
VYMISEYFIQWAPSTVVVSLSGVRRKLWQQAVPTSKATHPTAHPRVYFWYLK